MLDMFNGMVVDVELTNGQIFKEQVFNSPIDCDYINLNGKDIVVWLIKYIFPKEEYIYTIDKEKLELNEYKIVYYDCATKEYLCETFNNFVLKDEGYTLEEAKYLLREMIQLKITELFTKKNNIKINKLGK